MVVFSDTKPAGIAGNYLDYRNQQKEARDMTPKMKMYSLPMITVLTMLGTVGSCKLVEEGKSESKFDHQSAEILSRLHAAIEGPALDRVCSTRSLIVFTGNAEQIGVYQYPGVSADVIKNDKANNKFANDKFNETIKAAMNSLQTVLAKNPCAEWQVKTKKPVSISLVTVYDDHGLGDDGKGNSDIQITSNTWDAAGKLTQKKRRLKFVNGKLAPAKENEKYELHMARDLPKLYYSVLKDLGLQFDQVTYFMKTHGGTVGNKSGQARNVLFFDAFSAATKAIRHGDTVNFENLHLSTKGAIDWSYDALQELCFGYEKGNNAKQTQFCNARFPFSSKSKKYARNNRGLQGANEPGSGANEPGSGANEPGSGANEPGSGANEPGSGANEPGSGANEPGSGANEPGSGGQAVKDIISLVELTEIKAKYPEFSVKPSVDVPQGYLQAAEMASYNLEDIAEQPLIHPFQLPVLASQAAAPVMPFLDSCVQSSDVAKSVVRAFDQSAKNGPNIQQPIVTFWTRKTFYYHAAQYGALDSFVYKAMPFALYWGSDKVLEADKQYQSPQLADIARDFSSYISGAGLSVDALKKAYPEVNANRAYSKINYTIQCLSPADCRFRE